MLFPGNKNQLTYKVFLIFSLLLFICITSFIWVFSQQKQQQHNTLLINLSGRNCMLSQRIVALAQLVAGSNGQQASVQARHALMQALDEHETAVKVLSQGGVVPIIHASVVLSPAEGEISEKLDHIQLLLHKHKQLISVLLQQRPVQKSQTSRSDSLHVLAAHNIAAPDAAYKSALSGLQQLFISDTLLEENEALTALYARQAESHTASFSIILTILFFANAGVIWLAFIYLKRMFTPLGNISHDMELLAKGELLQTSPLERADELGKLSQAMSQLSGNLKKASEFAHDIGEGKLSTDIRIFDGNGLLAQGLYGMRNSLIKADAEEKQRNWTTEGISQLSQLLRSSSETDKLSDQIIGFLVKYLGANQGGFFICHTDNQKETTLHLIACYAYGKKKYQEKIILPGQGLVGQAYLEKELIHLRETSEEYVKITSGLGEANPRCILVLPLLREKEVVGVIELASFKQYESYQLEYLEKAAAVIAAAIASLQTNERTSKLLDESQQQAEELRAQEEEMRQNMEELAALQEEMSRKMQESLRLQHELDTRMAVLDQSAILTEADLYGTITYVNDKFCEVSKWSRHEAIGKPHSIVRHPDNPPALFQQMWETIKNGKIFKGVFKNLAKDGSTYWVDAIIAPILDADGKPVKYIGVRYDITENVKKEEKLSALLESASEQAEELKAQDEEMRAHLATLSATQEELIEQTKQLVAKEAELHRLVQEMKASEEDMQANEQRLRKLIIEAQKKEVQMHEKDLLIIEYQKKLGIS